MDAQAPTTRGSGAVANRRLPEDLFERFRKAGTRRSFAAGEPLFWEGDDPGSVYAIGSGRVKLFRTTPDGREILLDQRSAGHLVGEISAIDRRPRSASAVVIEPAAASVIPAAVFLAMLDRDPMLTMATMRMISDRLRASNDAKNAWRNPDIGARLAAQLIALLEPDQVQRTGEYRITANHEELAAWVGVNRETVTRALARMRADGTIRTQRGQVIVLDPVALQRRSGLHDA